MLDPRALCLPGAACPSSLARCPWAMCLSLGHVLSLGRFRGGSCWLRLLDVIQTAEQQPLGYCTFQALPLGHLLPKHFNPLLTERKGFQSPVG